MTVAKVLKKDNIQVNTDLLEGNMAETRKKADKGELDAQTYYS